MTTLNIDKLISSLEKLATIRAEHALIQLLNHYRDSLPTTGNKLYWWDRVRELNPDMKPWQAMIQLIGRPSGSMFWRTFEDSLTPTLRDLIKKAQERNLGDKSSLEIKSYTDESCHSVIRRINKHSWETIGEFCDKQDAEIYLALLQIDLDGLS